MSPSGSAYCDLCKSFLRCLFSPMGRVMDLMEEEIGCVNDGHYLLTSEDKPVGLGKEVKMRLYSITASQRALLSGRVT